MNRQELRAAIKDAGKKDLFWIRDESEPELLPDDVWIMQPEGDGWTVFYSERRQRRGPQHFATEGEACDYVFGRIPSA